MSGPFEPSVVGTDAFAAGSRPQNPFMVRLEDDGGGTRYIAIARRWTADAPDQHRAMGFEPGRSAPAAQPAEVALRLLGQAP